MFTVDVAKRRYATVFQAGTIYVAIGANAHGTVSTLTPAHLAPMIRMASEDGYGAVKLLGENDTG